MLTIFNKAYPKGSRKNGLTLVEILLTTVILVVVVGVLIELFMYCSALAEASGNLTLAMNAAQSKMEEIKNTTYDNITTDFAPGGAVPKNQFAITKPAGKGVIYIDSSNPDLLKVKVVVCWQNNNGRVVGEDQNLNGFLDSGEDQVGSGDVGQIDSEITMVSFIARR